MRWVFYSNIKNLPILSIEKAFLSCFVGVLLNGMKNVLWSIKLS